MSKNTIQRCEVGGMSCASCASAIEQIMRKLDGVEEAVVNFEDETANVRFDGNRPAFKDLQRMVKGSAMSCIWKVNREKKQLSNSNTMNSSF